MPFRAYQLKVGANTFLVPDVANAHTVEDHKLGPAGPVEFTMKTWDGLLGVEEGIGFNPSRYLSSRGGDGAFPGQVLIQPQATTVSVGSGQVALGSILKQLDFTTGGVTRAYAVGSYNTIHRTNTDTPPVWQSVGSLGGEQASDLVLFGSSIGVAHGSGFKHSSDGATWSADTDDADAFGVLGNTLYRVDRPNTIYAGSGGSFGTAWDSGSVAGDTNFDINSLTGLEQVLMIGREDGIYSIDADGTVAPFTPELRVIADGVFASVGRATVFNGDYYFATKYGLIQISGVDGQKRRIGLDQLATPDLPATSIKAICSDDRYLYAITDNTTGGLYILRRSIHGNWHVFYFTSSHNNAEHLAVSSALGYPALFFSYNEGGTHVTEAIRLSTFPNPLQDSSYRYDASGNTRWIRLGRFGPLKSNIVLDRCTILSENLDANITITPYISTEGAAAAQFGTTAANGSPFSEILPTTALEGRYFDAYVYLTTNNAATSPVLKEISFSGWLQPGMRRVHHYLIAAEGQFTTAAGDLVLDSPVTTVANLQTLRTTNGFGTIVDENGVSFTGAIVDVQRVSESGITKMDKNPAYILKVTIVEAPTSVSASANYGVAVYG